MKIAFGEKLWFIDGGFGTMLGKTDVPPEVLSITDPDRIRKIHQAYVDSGANIITTNTFGANPIKLAETDYRVENVIEAAIKIAREAAGNRAAVTLDVGPTGKLLAPMGTLSFEDAYTSFARVIRAGKTADMISIETMTDTYELKAAVLAAKENADLPVLATVSIDEKGRLLTGADIESVVALLEGLGVDALGLNCGLGPKQFETFLDRLMACSSIPVALLPNAGLPCMKDGETTYDLSAEEFAVYMERFAKQGVHILGGCCGTTPRHIALMTKACANIHAKPLTDKNLTVVSASGSAVTFGSAPIIIGERINPTGKKKFKEALRSKDIQYILREGIAQEKAGAHVLDVNVGLPEIDEDEMMTAAIRELQGILSLPLQIDTGDAEVLAHAARIYNGKPLLNSVNGKAESMEAVFPIVKKYGGVVIALTLDEGGIPPTAEGRIEIAKKIVRTAAEYGIAKKNIVIDALTLAVSAGESSAKETLRAIRYIKEEMGLHTVLGVSNISFGLPRRDIINATFFASALNSGLSSAIMNPGAESMMQVYDAYCVLHGFDKECSRFVEKYRDTVQVVQDRQTKTDLHDMILRGMKDSAYEAAIQLLTKMEPMELVQTVLIPALDEVGKAFEAGKVFLPQLLAAAETVKNAFRAVKESMPAGKTTDKGKIIIATVYGDIHDIGKNIVKLLLENYGYAVIDLGRDVPPEKIVETALQEQVSLVGLSALMTTTVVSMHNTIKLLHEAGYKGKVMVGGAVLTKEYAASIGADRYTKDALESVAYAKEVFA